MQREKMPRVARAAAIRKRDIEPYTALRWLVSLFKAAAIFLGVALVAEAVAGLQAEGLRAVPFLLGELARTAVLAVALWGAGDLVRLAIHLGHDVRAERILLARIAHRLPPAPAGVGGEGEAPVEQTPPAPEDREAAD